MQNGEKYANSQRTESLELIALTNGQIHMDFQVERNYEEFFFVLTCSTKASYVAIE